MKLKTNPAARTSFFDSPRLPGLHSLAAKLLHRRGVEPGVHIAATQRDTSQCPPISFTAVVNTAAAVVW